MAAQEALRAEALRYMGYADGSAPTPAVADAMERCFALLEEAAAFTDTWQAFPLAAEGGRVALAGLHIESVSLSAHLAGCTEALLYAATLGAQVDRLLQRVSSTDMGEAVVLQACAAALLEWRVDGSMEKAAAPYAAQALYVSPRYSPGYSDFSLEYQRGILRVLDTGRRIGLGYTQSSMLTPTKSITAVIGISPRPPQCGAAGCSPDRCAACTLAHCVRKPEKE